MAETVTSRRQQIEREALPLFAATIAAAQPTVDAAMNQRAASWTQQEQKDRAYRAAKWRQARTRLAGYGDNLREELGSTLDAGMKLQMERRLAGLLSQRRQVEGF